MFSSWTRVEFDMSNVCKLYLCGSLPYFVRIFYVTVLRENKRRDVKNSFLRLLVFGHVF